MPETGGARVAIVDFGMGNLFSVQRACEHVGLPSIVTSSADELLASQAAILPGVGAFGDAMATLSRRGLVEALRELIQSGKPFMGICLGMQLLMSESEEFGRHRGLAAIEGDVVRLRDPRPGSRPLKVPQVGWNRIMKPPGRSWAGTCLEALPEGAFMYFVHSFHVRPAHDEIVLATTQYGSLEFCSSLQRGNLFACQFHPERSGPMGLRLYAAFAAQVRAPREVTRV